MSKSVLKIIIAILYDGSCPFNTPAGVDDLEIPRGLEFSAADVVGANIVQPCLHESERFSGMCSMIQK